MSRSAYGFHPRARCLRRDRRGAGADGAGVKWLTLADQEIPEIAEGLAVSSLLFARPLYQLEVTTINGVQYPSNGDSLFSHNGHVMVFYEGQDA